MTAIKVSLIDYTGNGMASPGEYAAAKLIFAKSTRLKMSAGLFESIQKQVHEDNAWALKELDYIANTIPSSWEMVDMTFMVETVTRAFTHQFVRSRHLSFAQQAMRVLDMSDGNGWTADVGPTIKADKIGASGQPANKMWDMAIKTIAWTYKELIAAGCDVQDARGILPTNIQTNIMAKMNMRSFVELVNKRSTSRVQDEYLEVIQQMKTQAMAVYPWLSLFLSRKKDVAMKELDQMIRASKLSTEDKVAMIKKIDIIRFHG